MLAGMWPAYLVCVLAGPETAGPSRSQGCGPVMGSSEQWLARLVTSLPAGDVSGARCIGGPRRWPGPGVSTSSAGHNCRCCLLLQVQIWACLRTVLWQTWGFPSAAGLGLVDPVRVDGDVAVEPVPISGEPQKFSMGVTLPTVPARLVKRILAGKFVDMGVLSQEALRAEFRRSGEGEDQKPSTAKFRPVADRDAWVAGFAQYAGVVYRTHSGKAVALWGHLAVLMSCPTRSTRVGGGTMTCPYATVTLQQRRWTLH